MEPASPIQALGVNPFLSRFINRTIPWGGFTRWKRKKPMKIEKWQQATSALQKKMVLFINLLRKGSTQEINRDGGSIWWAPGLEPSTLSKKAAIEKSINSILSSETIKKKWKNFTEHSYSFNWLRSNGGKESYSKSNFGELAVRVEKKTKFLVFY